MFDEVTHTYWWGEANQKFGAVGTIQLPSVTTILQDGKKQFYSGTEARARGTRIHQMTEVMDAFGFPAMDMKAGELYPWLKGWELFKGMTGCQILVSEIQTGNLALGYAGTLDRIISMGGQTLMLDIKTGSAAAWHGQQLAAYAQAWAADGGQVDGGLVVYLKPNGKYTTRPYMDSTWEDQKTAWAQTLARYHQKHGHPAKEAV